MVLERDRLLKFLLGWALFTATLPTLILYRALVQPRYQWGLFGTFGEGVAPGLLVIAGAAALAWGAVVSGSVRPRSAGPLLTLLNGLWFGVLLAGSLRPGSEMMLRGDAWGLRVDLALVGPVLFAFLFVLSIFWWWKRRRQPVVEGPREVSLAAKALLVSAAVTLPAIVVLFALGDGASHSNFDRTAVVLAIVQCVFVGAALRGVRVDEANLPAA